MSIGKKTGEQFAHIGGNLVAQVEVGTGTAKLYAKIGTMNNSLLKEFTASDEPFEIFEMPKCACMFVFTGDATGDAESVKA